MGPRAAPYPSPPSAGDAARVRRAMSCGATSCRTDRGGTIMRSALFLGLLGVGIAGAAAAGGCAGGGMVTTGPGGAGGSTTATTASQQSSTSVATSTGSTGGGGSHSFETAAPIDIGGFLDGDLAPTGAVDYYTFEGKKD